MGTYLDPVKENAMKTIVASVIIAMHAIKWIMAAATFLILILMSPFVSGYAADFINLLIDFLPLFFVSIGALIYIFTVFGVIFQLSSSYHIFDIQLFKYVLMLLIGAVIFKTGAYSIFHRDIDLSLNILLGSVPIMVIAHARFVKSKKYPYFIKFLKSKIVAWINLTVRMSEISVSSIFTQSFRDYCNSMKININNWVEYLHNVPDHKIKFIQKDYMINVLNQNAKSDGPSAYFLKIGKIPTAIIDKTEKVHVWCKISASMNSIDLMRCDHHLKCIEWMNRLGVQTEFIGAGNDQSMMKLENTWTSLMLLYVSPAELLKTFAISRNQIISRMPPFSSAEPYSAFNDEYYTWYLSVQNPDLPSIDDMINRQEIIEQRLKHYQTLYRAGDRSNYLASEIMQCKEEQNSVEKFIRRMNESIAKGITL